MRTSRAHFKFENMWIRNEECETVVEEAWKKDEMTWNGKLTAQVKWCGEALAKWHRESGGNIRRKITKLRQNLKENYEKGMSSGISTDFVQCKQELNRLLQDKEVMWRQRSKALWLRERDQNSSYFHAVASKKAQG